MSSTLRSSRTVRGCARALRNQRRSCGNDDRGVPGPPRMMTAEGWYHDQVSPSAANGRLQGIVAGAGFGADGPNSVHVTAQSAIVGEGADYNSSHMGRGRAVPISER